MCGYRERDCVKLRKTRNAKEVGRDSNRFGCKEKTGRDLDTKENDRDSWRPREFAP